MLLIFFLSVVCAFAFYRMTPEERARLLQAVLPAIRQLKDAAVRGRTRGRAECEPFRDALRARTRLVLVTPILVALNVAIFVFMLFGAGALSDPATLVGWGANFGPRTTNGEWWRLVTSMFVHSGMLHLLVNAASLVSVGLILERLVGRLTFAAVYVAAGIFASLASLSIYPLGVSAGASGAIFGLYGLLVASSIWGLLHRSDVTIPLAGVKRLAPAAVVFILFNVGGDGVGGTAELTGLVAGIVCGLVLARGVSSGQPPPRRVAVTMVAMVAIAVASAAVLRGVTDVRPEIERVVAVEDHTAGVYRTAVERFRNGRITAAALAGMIDETIVPELHAADSRLKAVHGVPQEQQPLVADAEDYFRLRLESWRLRADGLRKADTLAPRADAKKEPLSNASWRLRAEAQHRTSLLTLGRAEGIERESLEALTRIKPAEPEVLSSKPADQK